MSYVRQFRHLDGFDGRYDTTSADGQSHVIWIAVGLSAWDARNNQVAGPHDELAFSQGLAVQMNDDLRRCQESGFSEEDVAAPYFTGSPADASPSK